MMDKFAKKVSLVFVIALLLVIYVSVYHACAVAGNYSNLHEGAGNMSHHKGNHAPQESNCCAIDMPSSKVKSCIDSEKAVFAASSSSLIPVYAGLSLQIESISFNPAAAAAANGIFNTVGITKGAYSPIYLNDLNLRC